MTKTMRIGMLLFPDLTQLDLTAPAEVFARLPGADVLYLWKALEPVVADRGLRIMPNARLADVDALDVICVPGGAGQIAMMDDEEVLGFLRRIEPGCKLVTSVCTGSLLLGAAGLLKGYKATCHWSSIDQLALLGCQPVRARVVRDRNRITGAGVTSGIDLALTVAAELLGHEVAKEIQLQMEYDPAPPYTTGSPERAPIELVRRVAEKIAPFIARRRAATEKAAAKLGRSGG